jgi:hypothetical protein
VGSGASFGASPLQQHIGLGGSAKIVSLEVYWPVSKTRQIFRDVEKNQFLEIKEFSDRYVKLDRRPFLLHGPRPALSASRNAAGKPGGAAMRARGIPAARR